jgi:catechol 2,3-dioxygenase-like lactoylglutathione lyase family enzyme
LRRGNGTPETNRTADLPLRRGLLYPLSYLDRCLDFYTRVLGMKVERYGQDRIALRFGDHKFNVHPPGFEAGIKARTPTPGSLDLCFLAERPLDEVIAHLKKEKVPIEEGPVNRTGARFTLRSVYVRDPDENLIEISEKAVTGNR